MALAGGGHEEQNGRRGSIDADVLKSVADAALDFDAFVALCVRNGHHLSERRMRELFDAADADKSGTIQSTEVLPAARMACTIMQLPIHSR